jgi:hypothetical protein
LLICHFPSTYWSSPLSYRGPITFGLPLSQLLHSSPNSLLHNVTITVEVQDHGINLRLISLRSLSVSKPSHVTTDGRSVSQSLCRGVKFTLELVTGYDCLKVKVTLWPTISRPVRLGVRHPSGTRDQFFYLLEIFF